ncbi:MAG: DUF2330 domain-containing protein [Flavobacteriales bacterium]|nr:DUF2330 domain-containing protein [Flavobacteriales bacterium]
MIRNAILIALAYAFAQNAHAFCGFYVAKADATLFNDRSEVILVRDGLRTVITMSNDFLGDVRDFAMVVPVPVVLQESDIRVVDRSIFQKLDGYSSPRLVEYWDSNPCGQWMYANEEMSLDRAAATADMGSSRRENDKAKDYGVTIEAQYTVGEYDILLLSATESMGLKDWLIANGYKIPATAHEVLDPYIKSNLKFFVVKVDLDQPQTKGEYLRPIQISFSHEKFMLPIRLGMANSQGQQDMIVYAFTRTGRVECVNYRTVKVPTDRNIPLFAQQKFGPMYKDLFARTWKREGRNAVFLEYAWNVTPSWGGMKCDPCVGPPPVDREFVDAGVNWIGGANGANGNSVFFTRLHVRYGRDKFPQDLMFQVTPNTEHFQARYILTHPAQGDLTCESGQEYLEQLYYRRVREMDELYALTGWDLSAERDYMNEVRGKLTPERRNSLDMVPVPGNNDGGGNNGWKLVIAFSAVLAGIGYALRSTSTTVGAV